MIDENGYKRAGNGRFAKGGKGGPGRPPGSETLKGLIDSASSDGRMERVVARVFAAAEAGDIAAVRLLWEHRYGKPTQTIAGSMGHFVMEPTTDDEEIAHRIVDSRALPDGGD